MLNICKLGLLDEKELLCILNMAIYVKGRSSLDNP